MQDEISKHGKQIYYTAKSPAHNFKEKTREIIIEIFIIVFAVTFSIWLHGWSEHNHEQEEATKFLIELKEDLAKDIELLKKDKQASSKLDTNFNYILSLKKNQASDSTIGPHTDLKDLSTNFNNGRYEGFKSSGKISTIENDSLKNLVLFYYQQTIPNLISEAVFINAEQLKILNAGQNEMGDFTLNEFLTTKKMHSMYYFLEYNLRHIVSSYETAFTQANKIIKAINKETGE